MSKSKILFFVSGSIAVFKACQVVSRLVQDGHEVQVVATPSALRFVGAATFEGLCGRAVLSDIWEEGRAMDHIHLTRWADFGVLCPASANTVARLSHGLADDLVSAMALAWPSEKPFHVFPAMNSQMLAASSTQKNLAALKQNGFLVHPTQEGHLACGEEGAGRLLEADVILQKLFLPKANKGRVLVTAGATREAIDGIRFISNVSTGQTGADLSDQLSTMGWHVSYLHGQSSQLSRYATKTVPFSDFADLHQKLRWELDSQDYAAVIHCAAVSDYSVSDVQAQGETLKPDNARKMKTDQELTLRLKANPKLLPRLKSFSRNPKIKVVGFKLTLNASEEQILAAAQTVWDDTVDVVVANDWSQVEKTRLRHPGVLMRRGQPLLPFQSLEQLALSMDDLLLDKGEKL